MEGNDSAQTGANTQQQQSPPPQDAAGSGAADAAAGGKGESSISFSTEQQAHIDKLVNERLARAQQKWQADVDAKKQADADAAEQKRLADEKKWEELAGKQQSKAAELEKQLATATTGLEKATALISGQLESRKKGLPEPVAKLLEGKDIFEQLAIVDAFTAANPSPAGAGQRGSTTPTPPPQNGQSDYVRAAIEKQKKQATENDPFAEMMKR